MSNIKKITALLAAALISFCSVCNVFAEPTEPTQAPSETTVTTENTSQDTIIMENPDLPAPDTSHAGAALLMDVNSNRVIYGKNIDKQMYPASTTKMMTAILALESDKMSDTVTATYDALKTITLEDSHMGILVGEELSMTDLINGMLVYSANDAANVIAIHVGGSMDEFVALMNAKAAELGMKNTNFVNACGVHDDNHYTTAEDLAILAKYCMQNETFRQIVKQQTYHIAPTNKYTMDRYLPTTNLFLSTARSASHLYSACTGIKTGTTEKAGHCLVSSAEHENHMSLIAVVLNCDDTNVNEGAYSYTISRSLFDFAFSYYESTVIKQPGSIVGNEGVSFAKNDERVSLTIDADISALVPTGTDVSQDITTETKFNDGALEAPIGKGEKLGEVIFRYHGTEIGTANLIAANDVELDRVLYVLKKYIMNPLILIPSVIIILVAIISITLISSDVRAQKRQREHQKRIQQIKQRRESANATGRMVSNSERNRTSSKGSNSRYSDDRFKTGR